MDKETPIKNGKQRNGKGQFTYGNSASVGKGRPKHSPAIPQMFRIKGNEIPKGETKTNFELMCLKVWDMALEGNLKAIEMICNRLEGFPAKQIIIESADTRSPMEIFADKMVEVNNSLKD